jgi:hypothetical protein
MQEQAVNNVGPTRNKPSIAITAQRQRRTNDSPLTVAGAIVAETSRRAIILCDDHQTGRFP